jgi:hypothetical protein
VLLYLAVVGISLLSCFVGFSLECVQGNIVHLKHGRPPNAGAALFPTLPVIPAAYLLVAWGVNQWLPMMGFVAVGAYSLGSIALRVLSIRRANLVLKGMLEQQSGAGA